jgi:SNF2 family DNA or RNA helicase
MVRVLDLLEELLKMMRYKYERLDGSTRSSSRAAAVERFIRKSCQRFVMLLSTRVSFFIAFFEMMKHVLQSPV